MKKIIARYYVVDCEHEGDIDYARMEVVNAGGKVITSEWDGEDCGEAYVYCLISEEDYEKARSEDTYCWSKAEFKREYFKSRKWID